MIPAGNVVEMTVEAESLKPRDYIVALGIRVASVSHLPEFHVHVRSDKYDAPARIHKGNRVTVHRKVQR